MGLIIHPNMTKKDLDYRIRCHFWRVSNIKLVSKNARTPDKNIYFSLSKLHLLPKDAIPFPPSPTLNQSTGNNMFQYQTFHMTLTQCFFALLHPDSIKNGLMAPLRDWRLFCHWALCSASWLMGSPGGLSEVSLKNKVWKSERDMCLQKCIGKWM